MKKTGFFILLVLVFFSACKKDDIIPKSSIVDNLDNFHIKALCYDASNTLWIASDSGLYKAVADGYQIIELGVINSVTALAYEPSINTLWVGTSQGIYQLKLGEADTIATAIAADLLSNNSIFSAISDENNQRWFGTEVGFTRSSGDVWQKEKFKMNASGAVIDMDFQDYSINSIGTWDGDFYFATAGNKLWRMFDWKTSVDAFTGATMWDQPYNGFAIADTMYAVFIDSKGQQWFGGKEGVQVHSGHDPKSDNSFFYDELVNPVVHCIAEDENGNIWVGTEDGISIFDGETWSVSNGALSNTFITAITFKDKKAWIGTKKGLFEVNY
ncbi:MAG: two-component regulator propeller domain-containing protein [Prolixibacteraceae bacterium]